MLLYRYSKLYLLYHVFVYPKHVSWVPFLSFFKLKRYSWKRMLWQTSACICSVAKSIILFYFEWKRLIYLFWFRWQNCCSKVLLWKENCLAYISVLYFERSCYNEEICKPVHSSVLCSIQNFKEPPPVPVFWLVRVQWKAGVCHPINTENCYTPADFWQIGQVWSLPGRLSFSSLVKIVEQ